jgi:8-oxo-dGTP diphosphatase
MASRRNTAAPTDKSAPGGAATAVAVDAVVFAMDGAELKVLLVQRGLAPFKGSWALPTGNARAGETLEAAVARVLAESTGVRAGFLEQLGAYRDPSHDALERAVSVAYLAFLPGPVDVDVAPGTTDASFVPMRRALDRRRTDLAFDHHQVLRDGLERARTELEHTSRATALCPPAFTLSRLRTVYEAVWGHSVDAPNFRRKVLATPGFVVPTGRMAAAGPEGGKPAQLYRAGKAVVLQPPLYRQQSGGRRGF